MSKARDLTVFLGSAVLSFALLAFGAAHGLLDSEIPTPLFLAAIVFCDVAHVWSTLWRTYADPIA